MQYAKVNYNRSFVQYACFQPKNRRKEMFAMIHVDSENADFDLQLDEINQSAKDFLSSSVAAGLQPFAARYFLSDVTNQSSSVRAKCPFECAISTIGQPPLDGSKIALWVWLGEQSEAYKHYFDAGMISENEGSFAQTSAILEGYEQKLLQRGLTIAENCVRTWLFVRDVDVNYAGVVKGRNANFDRNGLTKDTHYIASTGIEGRSESSENLVSMDAYSVCGLKSGQMKYLYAKAYLNPTYEYGVTFERGATVTYGDRKHLFISGTASIDNKGQVLHQGDVTRQSFRLWENVYALLQEGGADFSDLCYAIVYVRDMADYATVERLFRHKFPDVPMVITLAPVCRPAWLVEMECMAVTKDGDSQFADL